MDPSIVKIRRYLGIGVGVEGICGCGFWRLYIAGKRVGGRVSQSLEVIGINEWANAFVRLISRVLSPSKSCISRICLFAITISKKWSLSRIICSFCCLFLWPLDTLEVPPLIWVFFFFLKCQEGSPSNPLEIRQHCVFPELKFIKLWDPHFLESLS